MNIESFTNPWPVNIVIMAGGKGTRLKEITYNKPKALVEVGGKPIIAHLLDHLAAFGIKETYISVGHLSNQISDYLSAGDSTCMNLRYIKESLPMGSIGALTLKADWEHDHFMVINGDIFSNFNVNAFISAYFAKQADMAVLTDECSIEISYGVLEVDQDGNINSFTEKPEYKVKVSAGIYIFNKKVLALLPHAKPTEGWQLVCSALNAGFKVSGIPAEGAYWIDIGTADTLRYAHEVATAMALR
ncbi:nucleotidyltransferase family protein [Dyadobacter sp. MSC1_007]|jgi:NDP-sugar pyrophosphorylase family protein|uniref:nucleotidyltransferase family protein n=1 Tax=Dyadobacter sp. MSC1_007 TaxID=2909264 RepID=UPI00202F4B96|nr:nucleotidyltransferase family protein [Dyadobacter sp. MSC1_007]